MIKRLFLIFILATFSFPPLAKTSDDHRVLIVLTSHDQLGDTGRKTGFWLPELTHPYYRLKKANIKVDIASIKGGFAPIDARALTEPDSYHQVFLNDAELINKVINTIPLNKIDANDYDAVIFSGGSGPMWDFPDNGDVARVASDILNKNGVLAAVCHGVAAITNVKLANGDYLVKGKQVTGFSNQEESDLGTTDIVPFLLQNRLIERGGIYSSAAAWQTNVIEDGQLITGQNPASATLLAEKIIAKLDRR
ncbi:type 1 glutamine amidotransferase domain-containing protein [Pseudoalteromonas sp. Isolate6]|uniref:type 1 glutamine amidotransferase domain-containing protein n=1 Tax=Pseudoalteromonas sp. Isolate6 TaxID=2908527 RepID=UPI001EFD1307|nr:type 1 glutamine amidotransferase domain-containing protein [Pseudoalteromonas sp. Isolate6]MCG9761581.1 type 1 glutamine amidotransferase domain-containing protein [Pseudoalteromonas sp. Isolate6]